MACKGRTDFDASTIFRHHHLPAVPAAVESSQMNTASAESSVMSQRYLL